VFEDVELDSDEEDELVGNGDADIEGQNVDKGKGVEGLEAGSNGDKNADVDSMGLDMEGETEYEESSSSSGEEVEDGGVLERVEVSEGGIDEETFRNYSEEEGYKADVEESLGREGTGPESDIRGRKLAKDTIPSTNEIALAVDENDEDAWVNTSSPINSNSPLNRRSTSPTFTDSPTKRSVSGELTAAMANLSLTRKSSNSRIPFSTRSAVPRPSSARGTSRPSPKQPSTNIDTETGGLPYLRRTLNTGIPTSSSTSRNAPVSVPVSGSPSSSSNRTLPTPKRQTSNRSLPSAASESSTAAETLLEAARRRLSGGRSLRNISVTSDASSAGSGTTAATVTGTSNTTASISAMHAHLAAIENPSVSRRSLAHASAAAGMNNGNVPLNHGLRGLRHVGLLSVADKELPALPKGDVGIGGERGLPALPNVEKEGKVEMERLRKE
jgi:hypothetical protein